MWSHRGMEPYHCDHCEKEFTSKCDLEVQFRIYTGEKPYQ